MSYLMGIDIGSTSIKSHIYNITGNIIASGKRPTKVSYLNSEHQDWVYWDPEIMWEDTISVIREAVKKVDYPEKIKGIAVTGFGQDGLPVDEDGNWLYPFISWHCSRTEPQSQVLKSKIGASKIFNISGRQIMPIDSIYRIMWIKDNHPEILEKTDKWLLVEDYINYKLCGRKVTDYSIASTTSVLNLKKQIWSKDLIESAGIDKEIFPDIQSSGSVIGRITDRVSRMTGLKNKTPVVLGGHDCITASLAVGAYKRNVIMDICGTWETVLKSVKKPFLNKSIFNAGLTVESHVMENNYAIFATAVAGGMFEWYKNNFIQKKGEIENNLQKASKINPGSKGLFFLPHFSGAGTPINDNRSLGAFIGLSDNINKVVLLRGIIEGLNYQFREMLESLEYTLNIEAQNIVSVGGITRNKLWMQIKSDIIGKKIIIPAIEEASSLGAALLAGIGVGIYKDINEAFDNTFRIKKIYEPNKNSSQKYNTYYDIYKEIYPAVKNVNNKIFENFVI